MFFCTHPELIPWSLAARCPSTASAGGGQRGTRTCLCVLIMLLRCQNDQLPCQARCKSVSDSGEQFLCANGLCGTGCLVRREGDNAAELRVTGGAEARDATAHMLGVTVGIKQQGMEVGGTGSVCALCHQCWQLLLTPVLRRVSSVRCSRQAHGIPVALRRQCWSRAEGAEVLFWPCCGFCIFQIRVVESV